jgi:hypothetical protein
MFYVATNGPFPDRESWVMTIEADNIVVAAWSIIDALREDGIGAEVLAGREQLRITPKYATTPYPPCTLAGWRKIIDVYRGRKPNAHLR